MAASTSFATKFIQERSKIYHKGHLLKFIKDNGFGALKPLNEYKMCSLFNREIMKVDELYHPDDFSHHAEIEINVNDVIIKMIKILDELRNPALSIEEIDRLTREYYIGMYELKRLDLMRGNGYLAPKLIEIEEKTCYSLIINNS